MLDTRIVQRLNLYREQGMPKVTGWFDDESADAIATLLTLQLEWDVAGDVAEIGVHHGKSFLLLANGTRDNEQAVALDVFDDQEKNLDRSGLGDREQFEANAAQWAPHGHVLVEQMSSLEVEPGMAEKRFGRVRMFSIDGGHTAEVTAHDLRLAEACVVDAGVVVLDDVLNSHWLGVVSGLCDYLAGAHTMVPFAYSSNKLYFAPSAPVAERYATALRYRHPDLLGKVDVEFFGGRIDVYGQGSARRRASAASAVTAAKERANRSAAADAALRAERRERRRLERELKQSHQRAEDLRSSTSWRVTAGPRAVSHKFRACCRRLTSRTFT